MSIGLTRPARILYVEDHLDTFDLVAAFLEGSTVVNAPTASDGLREAMEQSFDLHLIDHYLPDRAGSSLCQLIRKFDADTPILLCSEDTGLTNAEALSFGANGILKKGINFLDNLAERVRSLQSMQPTPTEGFGPSEKLIALLGEYAAISDEIIARGARINRKIGEVEERIARAHEDSIRAVARSQYLINGGTSEEFELLWQSVHAGHGLAHLSGFPLRGDD